MLRKISVGQLRPGMYIHDLCGSWMEHPFWRTSFLLEDPDELRQIVDSSVREVWIDTSRGADAPPGQTEATAEAQVDTQLEAAAKILVMPPEQTSLGEEIRRAEKICARSKQAVVAMFANARLGKAIVADQALPTVDEIIASVLRHPYALIGLARMKQADDYTYMHSVAVCALMVSLARRLGYDTDSMREIGLGGLLHDIGKTAVPLEILTKPGALSADEYRAMQIHSTAGHRLLLDGIGIGDIPIDICLHHHEKVDGSGYPNELTGEAISQPARMAAVCDVYDAVTGDRRYKTSWNPGFAVRRMAEWCDGHFDRRIFHAFVKCVGIYPAGALVRLESGRLAVVVDQSPVSLLQPLVKVFFSIKSSACLQTQILDLSAPNAGDSIISLEDPRQWSFADLNALWSRPDDA